MRGLRHNRSGFAQTLAAFALLAMVVRALVPAGYMFAPVHDGRFIAITLCSGHGPAEGLIDLTTGAVVEAGAAHKNKAPTNPQGGDAPCVFAAAAALSTPEASPALNVAFRAAPVELAVRAFVSPGRGLAAPPPWATGPPLTA